MRIFLISLLAVLLSSLNARAQSCAAPSCIGPVLWPRAVPANVIELQIDAPFFAYPMGLSAASLLDPSGAVVDAGFDGHALRPAQPLVPGTYGVTFTDADHCGVVGAQALTVTASVPLPTDALGMPTVNAAWQGFTSVFSGCDGCDVEVMAASRTVSLTLPPTWQPWSEVTEVEVEIDGQQWLTTSDRLLHHRNTWQQVDVERGGAIEIRPFARCQPNDGVSRDTNGLTQGMHSGVIRARVRGTQTWLSSDAFSFELSCAPVCLEQNELCAAPDQLCAGTTFDAGAQPVVSIRDAGPTPQFTADAGGGSPTPGGCSAAPLSMVAGLALLLIRRKKA